MIVRFQLKALSIALLALVACDQEPVVAPSDASTSSKVRQPAPSGHDPLSDRKLAPMFRGEGLNELQERETHSSFLLTRGELRKFKRFVGEECGVEIPETAGTFVAHGSPEEEPRCLRVVVFRIPPEDALDFAEDGVRIAGEMCGPGKRWEALGAVQKLPWEGEGYGTKWSIGTYMFTYHRHFTNEYGRQAKERVKWLIDPTTGYVKVKDVRGGDED